MMETKDRITESAGGIADAPDGGLVGGPVGANASAPASALDVRARLEDLFLMELLGPAGGPEEELDPREDRVRERYLMGGLAPKQASVSAGELDELAVAGDDSFDEGATDKNVVQSDTLLPSSLGLTFTVDGAAPAIKLTARWGRYTREPSATFFDKDTGRPKLVWKREPIEGTTTVKLGPGPIKPWVVTLEQPQVTVSGRMRRTGDDWIVTLFLVNGQEEPEKLKDLAWLFQAELWVEGPAGEAIFRRGLFRPRHADPELLALDMLYHREVEFATGHGVSVSAEVWDQDRTRATRLMTRAIPSREVPLQTPPTVADNPDLAGVALDMKDLAQCPVPALAAKLAPLADAYEKWIAAEKQKAADPKTGLQAHPTAAAAAIKRCETALERIREGVNLLAADPQAAQAFQFANEAMWCQRIHALHAKLVRKGARQAPDPLDDLDQPGQRSWYPFQLAFILLNLPSATDLHHHDRSHPIEAVADLLWFPTGGGKTEAYLGLAAYVMALRRLAGEIAGRSGEHGVAVLMRYTLRLLTLQQFQRATALICACESIRRANPAKWGEAPFRIGLWVGNKATPNTTRQAEDAVNQSRGAGYFGASGTPAQLTTCPWCGTAIEPGRHLKVYSGLNTINRTLIFCGDELGRCEFSERKSSEGLPALVVDEEIYRHPPSLLIATVDKFAQMTWKGEVQMLFGQVSGKCPRHGFVSPETEDSGSHPKRGPLPAVRQAPHALLRPPDLIIQDELHLISGPLGSMVGLYETAVDELCSWTVDGKKVRPKVIASTATIRRAADQARKLFLRELQVFPPHGVDVSDNFFSRQRAPSAQSPGRKYFGICAIGKRYPYTIIRVYTALMAAAQKLYERHDAAVDPYMTLVGYFNSIRELAGTRRLVEDDIRARLRDADQRGLAKRKPAILEELTSRKGGGDIPRILDRLDVGFSAAAEKQIKALKAKGAKCDLPTPLDVVLATNMISVGVDIDRLGLMVVAGQPKTTAEYIQASSRVGRKFPGLIVTVYNWARPRDLSHYETFEHYHATFYKHVEALSVTPFSPGALSRGLTGIMIALVRLLGASMNPNDAAGKLERGSPTFQRAMDAIIERAALVMGSKSLGDEVRKMLAARRDEWLKAIEKSVSGHYELGYQDQKDGTTKGLLRQPKPGEWNRFTCLNSLRDVEPAVNLVLEDRYDRGLEPSSSGPGSGGQP